MLTLREMVKSDRALAAVSKDECLLIAAVVNAFASSWFLRLFLPKTQRSKFTLEMLAAVFARTNSFAEPDSPVASQIAKATTKVVLK